MTAKTHTGFGAPFVELTSWGESIRHDGKPLGGNAYPAKDGDPAVDLLPLASQEDEDKVKRLNELGFTLSTEMGYTGATFYLSDDAIQQTFATILLPYEGVAKNLVNLSAWLATLDPEALNILRNGDDHDW